MPTGYSKKNLIKFNFELKELKNKNFSANSPPSVFVGRFGYPNVNVGIISPTEIKTNSEIYDSPKIWAKAELSTEKILKLRSNLINSRFKAKVKNPEGKLQEISKEIAMAYKPVDIEVNLKSKPTNTIKLDQILSPLSQNAKLKSIKLTKNPKIKTKVEKVVSDYDLKATSALTKLYQKGIDENSLSKILSIGAFGIKKNRKLVPTRWSITATDDILSKEFIKKLKYYDFIENSIYMGGYLGNYFIVMTFPDIWGFELFEIEYPGNKLNPWSKQNKNYATDFEDYEGKKSYAHETTGGYYAARLPLTEKLNQIKKQGATIIIRIITEDDKVPLGVWVVREAMRKAMNSKKIVLEDNHSTINFTKKIIKDRYGIDIGNILKDSKLLKRIKTQVRLSKWF